MRLTFLFPYPVFFFPAEAMRKQALQLGGKFTLQKAFATVDGELRSLIR